MTIRQLCEGICLPAPARERVLAFAETFDFAAVEGQLCRFQSRGDMMQACEELRAILGEDGDHMKILACMLYASAQIHDLYRARGISDEVYLATMGCYTRFLGETLQRTGRLDFDRWWWTVRQAGFQLFRVGEMEYEIVRGEKETYIDMHIPSDADFAPAAVDASLEMAGEFFARAFPELAGCEYRCHSWLLARELREMLSPQSNILRFQERFEILSEDEGDTECIEWVFRRDGADFASLPENTSLQRKMKAHFLSGGVIHGAKGRLRMIPD